ncbi:MFS transporter [Pseudonocardia sp. C8]|uniref:MFS transporter n=1 Tax=Pseudonocardia sp. C8 TaxID=2762759 RepID=UPI0016432425|nr:MFS transporter [Pseudonocardia sp. C8]MBC3192179.1 MFS transporter [Pseudonocardia sp. C8]
MDRLQNIDNDPGSGVNASMTARLDRLPVTATHIVWIAVLAANLALEFYDNALFAYVMPAIAESTGYSLAQLGTVNTAFFVGMLVGALIGGRMADRFGRRRTLVWTTVLYSAGAIGTAWSPTFEVMTVSRIVTGLGVQAATSVLLVYVAEMFPAKTRGRFVSFLTFGFVVVAPLIALLALVTIPNSGPEMWRYLYLIGGIGLVIAPLVRFTVPESVRWYLTKGRIQEAENIVANLEERALRSGPLSEPVIEPGYTNDRLSMRALLSNKRLLRIIAIVSVSYFGATFGYYLFQNWALYSLVYGLGYDETTAYEIQLIWNVVYCVTPFVALLVMDRFERKTLAVATSVISAVPLVLLGISVDSVIVIVSGGLAAITTGIVVNVYYTYIPETIPTEARGLGSGVIIGVGKVGGAASGVVGAALFGGWGMAGVMVVAAAAYIVFSAVLLGGPRTANRSLEGVAAEELSTTT